MDERERQRRREAMREQRRKRVRRQRRILLSICGLLLLGLIGSIGFDVKALGNRREAKKIGKIADQSYEQFLEQNHLQEEKSKADSKKVSKEKIRRKKRDLVCGLRNSIRSR